MENNHQTSWKRSAQPDNAAIPIKKVRKTCVCARIYRTMTGFKEQKKVLNCFRQLHRTRKKVFRGDLEALTVSKNKINSEFRKNQDETDADKVAELVGVAVDAEMLLRTMVVQARLKKEGTYELRITEDTVLGDNYPFNSDAELPQHTKDRRCKDCEEKS